MGRPPRITREQILDTARQAFGARGFAATTLADIAAALEVTPAAILRHFDSKQALFGAAMSTRAIAIPELLAALAQLDPDSDPRVVLREFALRMVPFLSGIIRSAIAVQMHASTLVLPFNPRDEEIPPRRAIRILTDYFARAMDAGRIRPADPRALALLFLGQLQAYVFLHQVLEVTPAYPLESYVDALIDLWSTGAFGGSGAQKSDSRGRAVVRGGGGAAVRARAAKTEAARPRRNAGGKDGERGLAGRRPRRPRSRR